MIQYSEVTPWNGLLNIALNAPFSRPMAGSA
jgi:hypothetical protein